MYNNSFIITYIVTKTGKTTVSLKVQTNADIFCCHTPIAFKGEVMTSRGKEGPM